LSTVTGRARRYYDFYVATLDKYGNLIWQKPYGGSNPDHGHSVLQTPDKGFVVAGYAESNDGDVTNNHGDSDYWIIKLDTLGNLKWQKSFGGSMSIGQNPFLLLMIIVSLFAESPFHMTGML